MIKKLSLFFSAIAIGILSIFGSISTKNTAKPQYFLENTQVKKAVVNPENSTDYIFYLDNNFEPSEEIVLDHYFPDIYEIYLIDTNKNRINITLNVLGQDDGELIFYAEPPEFYFVLNPYEEGFKNTTLIYREYGVDNWLGYNGTENIEILGFIVRFTELPDSFSLETLNKELNPYIGYLTSLEQENTPEEPEEPIPPLEQINTLVSDIVNWFTNIFNGLGNVFYDPTTNKLTAWGTVMFIGVAIMLISMALKWVISLIRGV